MCQSEPVPTYMATLKQRINKEFVHRGKTELEQKLVISYNMLSLVTEIRLKFGGLARAKLNAISQLLATASSWHICRNESPYTQLVNFARKSSLYLRDQ